MEILIYSIFRKVLVVTFFTGVIGSLISVALSWISIVQGVTSPD